MDGTLVGDDRAIPPVNIAALRAARARGAAVALASGRMTACIEPFFDGLGIDGPVMAYNGALLRAERQAARAVLFHRPLRADVVTRLIDFAVSRGLQLNVYCDDVLYGHDDPALAPFRAIYSERTGAVYELADLRRLRGRGASKAIFVVDPEERERLYARWAPLVDGEASVCRTDPEYLEFMGPGINKGSGLPALAAYLGIGLDEIAAMGDGDNDLEMVRRAGAGIAVANAKDGVKRAARFVTRATAAEGAVAEALASLGLA
ncbi:MAG TPA: HAD family hydrolase [Planctomycetota bacterium]|nr:HAD family hydrolase [Planctomycetota bacterium]HNU25622.1 HAD family hydrolase [Planctomycetota bacterium]HOE30003.1 HAD family hydrolase [Planctomycetota bacterium]HOE87054.1 HAD family hydrolase [Planctomycetota bacterium]HOR67633.1 HAD family hydrolase [Planctomycetota bacterium]